jgi:hypothetical protein
MPRPLRFALFLVAVSLVAPSALRAQGWRPPSREMPAMPTPADLDGGWVASQRGWFAGVQDVAGIRGAASGTRAGRALQVRFMDASTPVPVAVWSDRNGDGKSDMIEIYRGGAVVIQLIDADFDGSANVVREYDSGGALANETRL